MRALLVMAVALSYECGVAEEKEEEEAQPERAGCVLGVAADFACPNADEVCVAHDETKSRDGVCRSTAGMLACFTAQVTLRGGSISMTWDEGARGFADLVIGVVVGDEEVARVYAGEEAVLGTARLPIVIDPETSVFVMAGDLDGPWTPIPEPLDASLIGVATIPGPDGVALARSRQTASYDLTDLEGVAQGVAFVDVAVTSPRDPPCQ